MTALAVGQKAPDFELKAIDEKITSLTDLLDEGKYLILAFYPAAWSGPCGNEMNLFNEVLEEFEKLNAKLVGISVDNFFSIKAWADEYGFKFTLLSDFHPKGEVAKQYGVLRDDGVAERALFIIDPEGIVRYSYVSPILENPGADRLFEALEKLNG